MKQSISSRTNMWMVGGVLVFLVMGGCSSTKDAASPIGTASPASSSASSDPSSRTSGVGGTGGPTSTISGTSGASGSGASRASGASGVGSVSSASSASTVSSVPTQHSIYFDFDSYVIKSQYNEVLESHARYLKSSPTRKIIIEGNADERGSREYNLSLGQKRSEMVRNSLRQMGAGEKQMEAISNGKEKPKATGQDEVSYAENRRSDIVYVPR